MSDKFTPGNWTACRNGECSCGLIFGGDGDVFVAKAYGPKDLGDGIDGPDFVPHEHHQKANARLIAAAPKLHEAARQAFEILKSPAAFDFAEAADVAKELALALDAVEGNSDG